MSALAGLQTEDTPASRFPVAEFRAAMEDGDPDRVLEHWTEDCLLRPLGTDRIRFQGKPRARAVLAAVFEAREGFHYTDELRDAETIAILFDAHVAGLDFGAVDVLKIDHQGRCREMVVLGGPEAPLSVFTGRVALAFARQGGGPLRRLVLNLLVWPLELAQRARARIARATGAF
jgi:hypothetical protein